MHAVTGAVSPLFSRIWSSRHAQGAAQSRVAEQAIGPASRDVGSLKTDAVLNSSALFAFAPVLSRDLAGSDQSLM
jgi:hypothetical protein